MQREDHNAMSHGLEVTGEGNSRATMDWTCGATESAEDSGPDRARSCMTVDVGREHRRMTGHGFLEPLEGLVVGKLAKEQG